MRWSIVGFVFISFPLRIFVGIRVVVVANTSWWVSVVRLGVAFLVCITFIRIRTGGGTWFLVRCVTSRSWRILVVTPWGALHVIGGGGRRVRHVIESGCLRSSFASKSGRRNCFATLSRR